MWYDNVFNGERLWFLWKGENLTHRFHTSRKDAKTQVYFSIKQAQMHWNKECKKIIICSYKWRFNFDVINEDASCSTGKALDYTKYMY